MKERYHYASVSEALALLKEKGYEYDFNINEHEIEQNPEYFEIHHVYRYEGNTNPDDESWVYGIQSKEGKKGVFVNGSSSDSSAEVIKFLHKLAIKE
ncbi:hypothetical protein FIA58_009860 [Flavobacterium jejuense]|uniref:Phosphoribosylpyrophosphate synthetase n=1 Tax=Flavobacterium jejuense TaxID=1544455 RepID=A0ABX0ITX6_9FLAO|nr:hypothetical protein [Flavobacterium jejuense]NHN25978.1 hypothetical protein [Flavobacterium jejuense]